MPAIGFNYQEFAQSIAQQAAEAMPAEITEQYKQFLTQVIYDFAMKAGEALVHEENSLLTAENVQTIIQFIAEWSFHKGIELMNSEIPPEHWLRILQTVAGGIFESGKNALIGGLDDQTVATTIQGEVISHYTHALNLLKSEGAITDGQIESIQRAKEKAQDQIVVEEETRATQQQISSLNEKESKLATIAVILSTLPEEKISTILESFSADEVNMIKHFMQPENMNMQLDPQTTMHLLASLKNTIMPEHAPSLVAKHIQNLSQSVDPAKIISILIKERPAVQNYVKACIEGKFIRRDFSPYLAKTILQHLQRQLNIT